MDKRTSMGIIGNLQAYTQYQAATAMEDAAKNPGGSAGAGIGMGMGMAIGPADHAGGPAGAAGRQPATEGTGATLSGCHARAVCGRAGRTPGTTGSVRRCPPSPALAGFAVLHCDRRQAGWPV